MSTLYRERSTFERTLLSELKPRLKGSRWKIKGCALFRECQGLYQDIFISVHRNAKITIAEHRVKPMVLDPILWDVLGIPENSSEPLSFRTWGAFTCSGLPICEAAMELDGESPSEVADKIVAFSLSADLRAQEAIREAPFSALVSAHPNHVARGAYAITLVTSLIAEGALAAAKQEALAYASGSKTSCAVLSSGGRSFHELAAGWVAAGGVASAFLTSRAGA